MRKFKLTEKGSHYRRNLRTCLDFLFSGGEITVSSGHTLAMGDDGGLGFKVLYRDPSKGIEQIRLMHIGSAEALVFLTEHANTMDDSERLTMDDSERLTMAGQVSQI